MDQGSELPWLLNSRYMGPEKAEWSRNTYFAIEGPYGMRLWHNNVVQESLKEGKKLNQSIKTSSDSS